MKPETVVAAFSDVAVSLPRMIVHCASRMNAGGMGVAQTGCMTQGTAKSVGVSWPTAHAAFVAHTGRILGSPAPVWVLGIDETRRGKPRWTRDVHARRWVRVDPWDTGFVDLAGDQGLLGQVEGRTSAAVTDWLTAQSTLFREQMTHVVIDPSAAYAAAVTDTVLPSAQVVVDHFHLVKLANDVVTAVRRRITFDARGRRGRTHDPEWANRRRLLSARERLSDRLCAKMWNALIDNDPSGQILSAYIAKGDFVTYFPLPAMVPTTRRAAVGSTTSTPGAPTLILPRFLGSRPPSRRGVRRSSRSCTPD